MILRHATIDDLDFLLWLRNDPESLRGSRRTTEIPYLEHLDWFLSTPDTVLIAEIDDLKVSTVRLVKHPHELEMGIVVAPACRGQGYAAEMIRLGAEQAKAPVVAYVREDNERSLKAFTRAGFQREGHYVRFTGGRG